MLKVIFKYLSKLLSVLPPRSASVDHRAPWILLKFIMVCHPIVLYVASNPIELAECHSLYVLVKLFFFKYLWLILIAVVIEGCVDMRHLIVIAPAVLDHINIILFSIKFR